MDWVLLKSTLWDHNEALDMVSCQAGLHREEGEVHQMLEGAALRKLDAIWSVELHGLESSLKVTLHVVSKGR